MTALYLLIPLALVTLALAVAAFLWAASHDQFEELEQEGTRIVMDDGLAPLPQASGPRSAQGSAPEAAEDSSA